LENGFSKGSIDNILFVRKQNNDFLLIQIYVNDIIFCSTNVSLCEDFSKVTQEQFEMSTMCELTFFLGLQINQGDKRICHKANMLKNLRSLEWGTQSMHQPR